MGEEPGDDWCEFGCVGDDVDVPAGVDVQRRVWQEVVDSREVAAILAPTSEPIRSVAQKRRKAGELIGLPIGSRPDYRYLVFQFDRDRHKIHDLVRYANRRLAVAEDPYGAASWWLTASDILDGRSPLEDLEAGELTETVVDNILDAVRRGT